MLCIAFDAYLLCSLNSGFSSTHLTRTCPDSQSTTASASSMATETEIFSPPTAVASNPLGLKSCSSPPSPLHS